jgi:two-component system CheB/CheR fusion protein
MLSEEEFKVEPALATIQNIRLEASIGEISRQLLLDNYAPAAVVINRRHEVLYALGSVGRYLSQPAGQPTQNLLDLTGPDLRARLRLAVQGVFRARLPDTLPGATILHGGMVLPYRIDIYPLPDDEPLQLICFVVEPLSPPVLSDRTSQPAISASAVLQQELQATKTEFQGVIRALSICNEEHRAINEAALAVNEEHQAAIEQLMNRKMEVEALSSEMAALNERLRETLKLQHGCNGTGTRIDNMTAAILLIDREMTIKFFTPAIQSFLPLAACDIGRPLSDFCGLASDMLLHKDCQTVLRGAQPFDREIGLPNNKWFLRRISPYSAENGEVAGGVISFSEITKSKAMLPPDGIDGADEACRVTNSHSKIQPLLLSVAQLKGTLNTNMSGDTGKDLIRLIGRTAGVLSSTLNDLLDASDIEGIGEPKSGNPTHEKLSERRHDALKAVEILTPREREIMKMVVAGSPSKVIATDLRISQRTVENHRAAIMRKTQSRSLPALARIAFASGLNDISESPANTAR